MPSETIPFLTSAALVVYAQRWMKTLPLYRDFVKALPGADKWAHRAIAMFGASVAALGIHAAFAGNVVDGGTLTVSVPSAAALLGGIWGVMKVYVLQQVTYDATKQVPREVVLDHTEQPTGLKVGTREDSHESL